ncbi:hypothetical protein O3P69_003993 [Scylla paramamosain]|uniref:Cuticle protein n=1 Tax=Scylla paramamosain TaxID=85552 RepID=A0AAW0UK12_SCYPA
MWRPVSAAAHPLGDGEAKPLSWHSEVVSLNRNMHVVPTPYAYDYAVSAGVTNFGQSEKGNGYGGVNGGYWVNLPDGRVQKVSYWADGSGYHPVVTYSGKAHYPASYGYGHGYH